MIDFIEIFVEIFLLWQVWKLNVRVWELKERVRKLEGK